MASAYLGDGLSINFLFSSFIIELVTDCSTLQST